MHNIITRIAASIKAHIKPAHAEFDKARSLESTLHPDPDYRERRRAALPRERRERFDQIVREFSR